MKNFSIVINVVLAIAVIGLYILHFSGGSQSEKEMTGADTSVVERPSEMIVAYIVEDSLLGNYQFFLDQAEKLEKKRLNLENDYTNKAQGLQTEINNFQRNAGNMTISQARAVEEDLMRKQQNLMRYQETLGQDLMKEEASVNNDLYERVSNFLKNYAVENNYTMVFNFRRGSAVLYGHQGLDVTKEVLDGLNKEYAATKINPAVPARKEQADSVSAQ